MSCVGWHLHHKWGRWEQIAMTITVDGKNPRDTTKQQRVCERCGKTKVAEL